MTDTRDEINDFLMGGGGKAFPFDNMGDTVRGVITSMTKRQQNDLNTGKPKFWDNGDPVMMLVITLETDLREDEEDDGMRNVYLRGGKFDIAEGKGTASLTAVRDAVKRSGTGNGLEVGGTLSLQWSGVAPKKGGFNPAKLYSAAYKPPTQNVDLDEMA